MDTIDIIKEIETTYDVSSIKVNGIQVWPFLRSIYFALIENENLNIQNKKKRRLFSSMKRVKNFFYGLNNLFKRVDYIAFSDTMELRSKDRLYINKLFNNLYDVLGKDNTIVIENPNYRPHYNINKLYMKNVMSLDFFNILCRVFSFNLIIKIENERILKDINLNYNMNIGYMRIIKKFFYYHKIFTTTLKIKNPKIIFISDYYNLPHQALIYTARKLGIKVVELQHGIINSEHTAYNVFTNLDKLFFPEYLLVFGNHYKQYFDKDNYFIDKKNVLAIGNMYIHYINNNYIPSEKTIEMFNHFRNKYDKIIAISSQILVEDELIDFLKKSASASEKFLYTFVPRYFDNDYSCYKFPPNIIILSNLDVYKTIKEADFHATVNSSCAVEAPALGAPNILINIKNESKRYYSKILTNPEVTKFVDTPEEFVNLIQNWVPKSKEEIKQLHEGFYAENHKESLKKALDIIMNDNNL